MASRENLYELLNETLQCIECDSFISTPIGMFPTEDLKRLKDGRVLWSEGLTSHKDARDQECHAISAWAWLNDKSLTVYYGMAYLDEFSDWVQHSFLTDKKGILIEPTPLLRSKYFGTPMNFLQTLEFVKGELNNIRNIGLDPDHLWHKRIDSTIKNFDKIVKKKGFKFKSVEKLRHFLNKERMYISNIYSDKNELTL